jgi:hypothetical protein
VRFDARGDGVGCGGYGGEGGADSGNGARLTLPERVEDVVVAPGVQPAIAPAHSFRLDHWLSAIPADTHVGYGKGSKAIRCDLT